jgi:hypothetical protein
MVDGDVPRRVAWGPRGGPAARRGPYKQAAAWDAEIPWILATVHAAVGATDEGLHWLDRTITNGMINSPFFSEHDLFLDDIRGDPRFASLRARAGHEWERFEV